MKMDVVSELVSRVRVIPRIRGNPLVLNEYGGKIFASGLFAMMDQEGFPLSASIDQCRDLGWHPCLEQFIADAMRAGWTRTKAVDRVREACTDSGWPVPDFAKG